ncbi:MAG: hypothetical protein AB3N21_11630 [Ruegeria sp.]|uniref:hypothetical protein n=1 Tax=Ruegeria sp. TaxID=1879320 RepID=UPI00349ED111
MGNGIIAETGMAGQQGDDLAGSGLGSLAVAGCRLRLKRARMRTYTKPAMQTRLRTYLALALSALLALTGQSLAASRGLDAAVGQMEICTGTGPVIIYMDAEGQPTQAPHYCPDFALTLLGAIAPDAALLPPAPETIQPTPQRTARNLISPVTLRASARAPPRRV